MNHVGAAVEVDGNGRVVVVWHMFNFQQRIEHLKNDFVIIAEHWLSFVVVAFIVGGVTWVVVNYFHSQRFADYDTHVSLLQDQLKTAQLSQSALSSVPPSQWRRLTDEQRNKLMDLLSKPENRPPTLVVYAMAELEIPRQYAAQFVDILRSSGAQVFPREVPLSAVGDVGLMIGVGDINNPTAEAKRFAQLLKDANIGTHYTLWIRMNNADNALVNFDLYVGPKPW